MANFNTVPEVFYEFVLPGKFLIAVCTAEGPLPRMRALVEHELLWCCKNFATILTRELRWMDAAVLSVHVEG
jgi:hypothetical protein